MVENDSKRQLRRISHHQPNEQLVTITEYICSTRRPIHLNLPKPDDPLRKMVTSLDDLLAAPLTKRIVVDEQFTDDGEQCGRLATLPCGETIDGIRQGTFFPREQAYDVAGQLEEVQRMTR
ncbi:hypothetical protein ASD37_08080 [Mycobacterium sp. Root135]|uniref:hypothetical protein n=1 Tax=Mycobacterium sp. Root135 TaxID=1736457 RepID=UPI0007007F66|nr:hypothetical protein [Mycobacterium sp. Root135]KQY07926.1 hypothetical protein ASD37_08080 [Mycobacterium sp. Root135]